VTVQLPDLAQLHADAVRLSPGGSGGVRFQSPPRSQLSITATDLQAAPGPNAMKNSGFQICSFAIPLITIVAFFVFQLFLPIVVFIFQLWFLLTLRFCIPPDVTAGVNFAAELDAIGGGVNIDAGAVATIETADETTLAHGLDAMFKGINHGGTSLAQAIRDGRADGKIDTLSFGSLLRGVFAAGAAPPQRLTYAKRVERSEVVRP
jgi:hypothetical protein